MVADGPWPRWAQTRRPLFPLVYSHMFTHIRQTCSSYRQTPYIDIHMRRCRQPSKGITFYVSALKQEQSNLSPLELLWVLANYQAILLCETYLLEWTSLCYFHFIMQREFQQHWVLSAWLDISRILSPLSPWEFITCFKLWFFFYFLLVRKKLRR
jgi:hypothetical protein